MSTVAPFGERLLQVAAEQAATPAIRHHGEVVSYERLAHRSLVIAELLRNRGLGKGDRVLVVCDEKLPMLLCHLGAILAGGMSVPLNPAFTPHELGYFLSNAEPRLAIADGTAAEALSILIAEQSAACELVSPRELTEHDGPPLEGPSFRPDDDVLMLYSSGTTGQPKGAVHSHGSLTAAVTAIGECWRFTPDDVLLNCLPLYHIHGLSFACHTALLAGCEIMLEDSFHPRRTMEQIAEASVFYGIPPYHYAFLKRPEFAKCARQWKKLRLITCGSAPIRPEVLPELEETVGRPIINRYGMTETHVIASLPLDGPHKQGSVGLPLPGIEMVVKGKSGQPADVGEVGGVWVRGHNLFQRYWRMPDPFAEGGWFETGDLGELDADGFLTLRGREKDLIIVNGLNVYPPVVERVLNSCPLVRESAVIGLPDDRKGERVVAVVVPEGPEADDAAIHAHCAERMVDYQRPDRIIFVEELPRNTMGKVLKRELREKLT